MVCTSFSSDWMAQVTSSSICGRLRPAVAALSPRSPPRSRVSDRRSKSARNWVVRVCAPLPLSAQGPTRETKTKEAATRRAVSYLRDDRAAHELAVADELVQELVRLRQGALAAVPPRLADGGAERGQQHRAEELAQLLRYASATPSEWQTQPWGGNPAWW
eukprot:1195891-Prorocentrum_minimum.AAC.1